MRQRKSQTEVTVTKWGAEINHKVGLWWDRWPNFMFTKSPGPLEDEGILMDYLFSLTTGAYYQWWKEFQTNCDFSKEFIQAEYNEDAKCGVNFFHSYCFPTQPYPFNTESWSQEYDNLYVRIPVELNRNELQLMGSYQRNIIMSPMVPLIGLNARPDLQALYRELGSDLLGCIWSKITGFQKKNEYFPTQYSSWFWENHGCQTYDREDAQEGWNHLWENIPYGAGISPDAEGSLVGIIKEKNKVFYVWRKTDEVFDSTFLDEQNNEAALELNINNFSHSEHSKPNCLSFESVFKDGGRYWAGGYPAVQQNCKMDWDFSDQCVVEDYRKITAIGRAREYDNTVLTPCGFDKIQDGCETSTYVDCGINYNENGMIKSADEGSVDLHMPIFTLFGDNAFTGASQLAGFIQEAHFTNGTLVPWQSSPQIYLRYSWLRCLWPDYGLNLKYEVETFPKWYIRTGSPWLKPNGQSR